MGSDFIYPLCFECGLCCNGVIFADVELGAEDGPARSRLRDQAADRRDDAEGAPRTVEAKGARKSQGPNRKFPQPCVAFDGCRCRIYAERPKYCREFECLLLREVSAGKVDRSTALRVIRTARQRADRVKRLLIEMGDDDEHVALSVRFRHVQKRMDKEPPDEDGAELFSRLTLAVHDLNVLLRDAFYR